MRILGTSNKLLAQYRAQIEVEREQRAAARTNFHLDKIEKFVFQEAMRILAREVVGLCVEYLIVAPPGLHFKLMRKPVYRKRVEFMRVI